MLPATAINPAVAACFAKYHVPTKNLVWWLHPISHLTGCLLNVGIKNSWAIETDLVVSRRNPALRELRTNGDQVTGEVLPLLVL